MQRGLALALLLAVIACNRAEAPRHEAAMQQTLGTLRTAIAKYRDDSGRGPATLEELVPRYLASVPADPVTQSATTWRLTTEEVVQPNADFSTKTAEAVKPQIIAINSGAPGADANGKPWSDY